MLIMHNYEDMEDFCKFRHVHETLVVNCGGGKQTKLARDFQFRSLMTHIHNCHSDCTSQWITAVRIEVQGLCQNLGNFLGRHNSADGESVPDSLCHGDDVWNNAVRLKTPVLLPGSAKSRLHLVTNKKSSIPPNNLRSSLDIISGKLNGTADALIRLGRHLSLGDEPSFEFDIFKVSIRLL
jgi:hypothetical protein